MKQLDTLLQDAVATGQLLPASRTNINLLLSGTTSPIAAAAIAELAEHGEWNELNDRFYKTLAFGTGGLRGRTIGSIVTSAEQGAGGPNGRPEFPCIGTACMNYFNVGRAMQGLIIYVKRHVASQGTDRKPRIVIGHDTRHFSRDFAEYCAKIATDLGCDAYLFDAPRATPEISFAIRELNADTGIVLTASHNPAHDNGFKAYFDDGAQLVPPHDKGVIDEVNRLASEAYEPLPADLRGTLSELGAKFDRIYMDRLKSITLQPGLFSNGGAKVVYTNLHGTGGHIIVPLLREIGCDVATVASQDIQDGRFPTVKSPNPENSEALTLAIDQANASGADIVIATDPDCDRMGVAVREASGNMRLLTGNQVGSLLAWYRCKTMTELGWINDATRSHAVMIKTFVTSQLQDAIGHRYGIEVVNVLTGFKYIAQKLGKYEEAIPAAKRSNYRTMTEEATRALRLEYSRFFVFGGEESYGYLAQDFVRDKDANAAALLFAELAAYAASIGKTIPELLDELFSEYGVHLEMGKSLVMEGADGAAKIAALAKSYVSSPMTEVHGMKVVAVRDFTKGDMYDEEGDPIPPSDMIFMDLEGGYSFAVRPSGTEPKIKYYFFGKGNPGEDVPSSMNAVQVTLDALWKDVEADAVRRTNNA
ncbi:phospho-sugar mutase [Akkermansia sp. N21116]|uniref:phospho-sugar mutase n=1 Tax=Akkermansia sp. N21116 TaxID=3040764 RepID=UPI00244E77F7|nr:phospho-sugar mutase [Akkermansia sp. N21116]WPX41455.1 phospho-sugar mutase [Akkermansia sp. N21116]